MLANDSNTKNVITILIHSDKTHFQNIFVMLLPKVIKLLDMLMNCAKLVFLK